MRFLNALAQLKSINLSLEETTKRDRRTAVTDDDGVAISNDLSSNIIGSSSSAEEPQYLGIDDEQPIYNSAAEIMGPFDVIYDDDIDSDDCDDGYSIRERPIADNYYPSNIIDDDEFHEGFNVADSSMWMAHKYQVMPSDAEEPLFPGSSISKLDFCKSFQRFVADEALNDVASNRLLGLLKEWLPTGSNLPIHEYTNGSIKSTVSSYVVTSDSRLLSFSCCTKGDCVFIGANANLIFCPRCKEERFHPCTSAICKSKMTSYKNCPHTRSPKSIVHYRPILPIIKDLLDTKMFVKLLKYKHYNHQGISAQVLRNNAINQLFNNSQTYSDILDSALATQHLMEMEEKAQLKEQQGIIPINLLLGYNYDGCQPFGTKATNFWPMTLTILNLPPNLRKKVGMGMFLLSIYYMSKETYVEDFLHRDCLVKELLMLYDGYEIQVGDKTFFVQARLICHGYDTKAAEHVLRVQASGSLSGCPFCRLVCGARRNWSGSVYYAGHRRLLSLKHFLRSRGQSQLCCPEQFYSPSAPSNLGDEGLEPVIVNWSRGVGLGLNHIEHEKKAQNLQHLCCSERNSIAVKNFLKSSRKSMPFEWHHDTYDHTHFSDSLYYYHMDYRDQVSYCRVTNDTYLRDGRQALQSQSPVNGVKGLWCFRYLPYADFATQVNWDPFHTLMNVAKNVINIWKGTRPVITDSLLAYCRHTCSHPELWQQVHQSSSSKSHSSSAHSFNKWKIPVSSIDELNNLDRYFEALLIPKGYSKDFEAHQVFTQTGYLKGYTSIQFIEVLMDYFVYAVLRCKYRDAYPEVLMKFLVLLSEDFSMLLSTNPFTDKDIDNLFYRIVELVELHQGLYPTSEALIIYHQLIDLPYQIRQLGPLRNWWTLAGERFMSAVKESLPQGGRSYVTTVIKRHVNMELQTMKDYDDCDSYTVQDMSLLPVSACTNHALFPSTLFNIVEKTDHAGDDAGQINVFYCERITKLMIRDSRSLKLSDYEFSRLLLLLVCEARTICQSFLAALQGSPLFRLYCAFVHQKKNKVWTKKGQNKELDKFCVWLRSVGCLRGKEGLRMKGLLCDQIITDHSSIVNSEEFKSNIVNNGLVYLSDWDFCKNFNDNYDSYRTVEVTYKKCLANGAMFRSRGREYRESEEMLKNRRYGQQRADVLPSNQLNRCLAEHCGNAIDYSSWCRILISCYQDPSSEKEQPRTEEFEFGQLNCFFRCRLPRYEYILNDIPIASICVRKTERLGRNLFSVRARDVDNVHDHLETTLKPDLLFCAVYNIYPTPIIVAPMAENMTPVSKKALIGRNEEVTGSVQYLLLIQMHRHRTINFNFRYPNLETMQLLTSSSNDHP